MNRLLGCLGLLLLAPFALGATLVVVRLAGPVWSLCGAVAWVLLAVWWRARGRRRAVQDGTVRDGWTAGQETM